MPTTPKLLLPYLATGQAQKEITHNEALNDLDALVQLRVLDRDLATPPGSPAEGAAYIVAAAATGAWSGQSGKLAFYYSGWRFKTPLSGWRAYVVDESLVVEFDGTSWNVATGGGGGGLASLGTVAAPGISFTSDSDTGFYSDGANSLRLVTAATERLRVGPSGTLSVGSVNAPSNNAQSLFTGTSNDAPYLQVGETQRALYIGSSYDGGGSGTSYLGFNAARSASNTWTFDTDGTTNGGGIIDHAKNGGMRFYTRTSGGGTSTTMTDSGLVGQIRMVVHASYVSLGGDSNVEALRIVRTSGQVNRIEVTGTLTGTSPSIAATGSDTNIDLSLLPKGTGRLNITVNTANAVTTVGAAGGASALPATPLGYLRVTLNGSIRKIPYYLD